MPRIPRMYLNTEYFHVITQGINKSYVFRDRYKAEGIYTESHLYSCIKYIYNNPVKAGLCNQPEEYLYSNYKPMGKAELDEDYMYMDIVEDSKEIYKRVLEKFLLEENINLEELKEDEDKLCRLFVKLKRDYKISLREIAINFKLNREKVRKIFNKK